ncbi:hypothetical protein CFC21_017634 [Triticum aestivum]|uniref:Eukaryotic translation initiation factor 4B1 n=3 Tax=Triticum TaxID=4564 RepID=A0A9R1R9N9_TRITD|nr:eukaryotic translation initiation factor 4B1-like [Triticum aestivum]KAF7002096.1 hypothetical protein CFC21_017634 [Triticum aestivum]VAH33404.1 unnamed protein product [Triticum turgidum subsp. durum]
MAKPWGGVGAWALDAEREDEEREHAAAFPAPDPPAAAGGAASFPSLKEAVVAGGGKQKKKKGTTLSLSEFTTYGAAGAPRRVAPAEPKGLTPQEMMMLPTGPRERSEDELDRSRGFRSYGGDREPRGGGFDDDRRSSRDSDLDMHSRADESDNWGKNKSFSPAPTDSGLRDRLSGPSPLGRSDDIDNWSRDKKPLPSRYPSLGTGGGFRESSGGGFRESSGGGFREPSGGGFRESSGGGFRDSPGPSDSDRWVRGAVPAPMTNNGDRPRLNLNPPKRDPSATPVPAAEVARSRPSPFGAAKPREEVLAEKGLDWRKMEGEIEKKTSRPTSSHSSRPNSAHSSRPGSPGSQVSAVGSEGAPRARPKVNPFGDAKPREVVLQEKGKDWRKIDLELEHRAVNRPESEEEKNLKEEINLLKVDLKEIEAIAGDGSEQAKEVSEKISQMEKQLDLLTVELDDKIRFGQRPSSGAGRAAAFPSASEEPHVAVAHMDRPRSRGGVETYPKPVEERWGFHGSRERGSFGGGGSSDRSSTRQGW